MRFIRGPKNKEKRRRLSRALRMEALEDRRVFAGLPFGAQEADLGEFLLGSVAVTPIFLESDGSIDESTEDWDQAHIQEVLGNINEGLQWWVDSLDSLGSVHTLNFEVDTTFAETPAASPFEGINRRSNDYVNYVAAFLSSQGYSSGGIERNIRDFNQDQREKLGTDWSFTMFVVPSQNDEDGQFAAGGSFRRAFAFAGGLFMVVPSTRPASTFAHELGHIFWARDEYPGGGTYFSNRGYYNTRNENAWDNPTPGFQQQPSIMAAGDLLLQAYDANTSPASTFAQVGWQDSDGDGIFDVLDVPHTLRGSGYYDSANGNYIFNGSANVNTLPNLNSSGLQNDITLNRIREIEYRIDGGAWQIHSQPNVYETDLNLSIPVASGANTIEIRARDSQVGVVSNVFVGRLERADSTLVPGINGFTWIDANDNSLRDLGEFGQANWLVELVDGSGQVLDLKTIIEPDNYDDGVLASNFDPRVALAAVGSQTDGRVAVFTDTKTSTGTKSFRHFSIPLQTFVSTWNSDTRRLQATFSQNTTSVRIDAIGAANGTYGRLNAYNSAGQLVGRYTTGRLENGQVETMVIERPQGDISYIIAGGSAGTSVHLDNLQFGPESSTMTNELGGFAFSALPPGDYNVRVTPAAGYRGQNPASSTLPATVVANTATTDVDFAFEAATSDWQNPNNVLDVNDDQIISALDVLLIINEINSGGSRDLTGSDLSTPPYVDVTGEAFLSAIDVLQVVNFLNGQGGGEGEQQRQFTADSPSIEAGVTEAFVAPQQELVEPTEEPEQTIIGIRVLPETSFYGPIHSAPAPEIGSLNAEEDDEDELLDLLAADALAR